MSSGLANSLESSSECEAMILAGGLSSRMGRDKAKLRLRGKSLLAHARRACREAGLPSRVIRRDLVPRCGPLGGVLTGLRLSRAHTLVFLSCDMPFLTGAIITRLLSETPPDCLAGFTYAEQIGFPFLVRRGATGLIEKLLAEGQFSLRELARSAKAVGIPLARGERAAVFNINTADDLAAAISLAAHLRLSGT